MITYTNQQIMSLLIVEKIFLHRGYRIIFIGDARWPFTYGILYRILHINIIYITIVTRIVLVNIFQPKKTKTPNTIVRHKTYT